MRVVREARIRTVPCQQCYVLWDLTLITCEQPLGLEISRVLGPIVLLASLATRLSPRLQNSRFVVVVVVVVSFLSFFRFFFKIGSTLRFPQSF